MAATEERVGVGAGLDYTDIEHTGPGTLAGRYLRTFWHPVYRSDELPAGRAKPVKIMGEEFTLYRGEGGQVHAVGFRCAHRGTQMSTGWVEGDTIRCFYHGWVYDGNGQCVEQPAEPEPFCNRIKIKSYPVQEYLGMIFVYQGEGEPPPFPRWGVGESASLYEVETFVWPYNYFNILDNLQDYAHHPFVHQRGGLSKTFARKTAWKEFDLTELPTLKLEETEWGYTGWRTYSSGITRIEHIVMPNIFLHKSRPGNPRPGDPPSGWRDTVRWAVPIDDEHMMDVSLYCADATPEEIERYREWRKGELEEANKLPVFELVQEVLQGRMSLEELAEYRMSGGSLQDAVAQWGQGTIPDRKQDHLGFSDASPALYRRLFMRDLQALAEGRSRKQWQSPLDLHATWVKDEATLG
jgi:5,5'-dehydrodivanillate O-demethylase oxygenase subunit